MIWQCYGAMQRFPVCDGFQNSRILAVAFAHRVDHVTVIDLGKCITVSARFVLDSIGGTCTTTLIATDQEQTNAHADERYSLVDFER